MTKIEDIYDVLSDAFPEDIEKAIDDAGLYFVPFEFTDDDRISVMKGFIENSKKEMK